MKLDYFPLGTAQGLAFCNRKQELTYLTNNLDLVRPTLIMSPRRYGKTSLALRTLTLAKAIYTHIDLYKEINADDVAQSIIAGVGDLLSKIEPKSKNLLSLATDFFSDLHVNFSIGELGISVQWNDKKKPTEKIQHILKRLEKLAEKRNVNVVLYIDEFQKLADIEESQAIEAIIRHEAQISKHVMYLFSGSNRHLIQDMFFDSNRPFYKLCDVIHLERIEEEPYQKYLQKSAKDRWSKTLSAESLETIFELTERHPYYVNLLCFKLWLQDVLPTPKSIVTCWQQCAAENRSQIEREIDLLTLNQKKLIIALARYDATSQPTSKAFLAQANLSGASVSQALNTLMEKDYIFQDNDGYYRLLDPMVRYLFERH